MLLLRQGGVERDTPTNGQGGQGKLQEVGPRIGHVLNELCARHWPTLEAATRCWGHRLFWESLHLRA